MAIGGYRVIDLDGLDIGSSPTKVEGIYNLFEESIGKPILLRNYSILGTEQQAAFVSPYSEQAGGGVLRYVIPYSFTANGYNVISINSNDEITKIGKVFA